MAIIATIKGKLMEKYQKPNINGEIQHKAVIYQPDAKSTQEIGINFQTFERIKKDEEVSIPVRIDAFKSKQGNVILYAKETS